MFECSELQLEYLEKKSHIENVYNNPTSYINWNGGMMDHPIRKMQQLLDELDDKYLPLLEKEKSELFD